VQATYFMKACGVSRFAYNWALAEWKRRHEAGEKVDEGMLRRELNAIKRERFPWMYEVTKCAPQLAIKNDLNNAFRNFFSKRAGYPKFRKKGVHDSFGISNDQFKMDGRDVWIPNLGRVRMEERLRFAGKIMGATVSRTADRWYIAIQVEMPDAAPARNGENQTIGVDLGVAAFATLSDGTVVTGAKASRQCAAKLRRLNQELSRRRGSGKGETKSCNFKKTKRKISRLYAKMANIRADQTHKLTTTLTRNYGKVTIEDLNVSGMMRNHRLARSVADMSFFEFRRQMAYKAEATGTELVIADRWFASSKMCHKCGFVRRELGLGVREWTCEQCGAQLDRETNAAINLDNYSKNGSA